MGCNNVRTVNPNNLNEVREALKWAMELEEPSVIITRLPCVLKKFSDLDLEEFELTPSKYEIDIEKCIGCKICTKCGCPAIRFINEDKKCSIDYGQCIGCSVCAQICPIDAIYEKVGDN